MNPGCISTLFHGMSLSSPKMKIRTRPVRRTPSRPARFSMSEYRRKLALTKASPGALKALGHSNMQYINSELLRCLGTNTRRIRFREERARTRRHAVGLSHMKRAPRSSQPNLPDIVRAVYSFTFRNLAKSVDDASSKPPTAGLMAPNTPKGQPSPCLQPQSLDNAGRLLSLKPLEDDKVWMSVFNNDARKAIARTINSPVAALMAYGVDKEGNVHQARADDDCHEVLWRVHPAEPYFAVMPDTEWTFPVPLSTIVEMSVIITSRYGAYVLFAGGVDKLAELP